MSGSAAFDPGFPVEETIRKRKSVRTYDAARPVPGDVLEKARAFAADTQTPFGADVRIAVLDALGEDMSSLGTYGVVRGTHLYAAAAVRPAAPRAAEQVGYAFERFVLRLTALGLGTCWLAGTFRHSAFEKAAGAGGDEALPVALPFGYASASRSLIDRAFKPQGDRVVRRPWSALFFNGAFGAPLRETAVGEYALPLEMARLAPSATNKQPWRVVRAGWAFCFYVAHDAQYQKRFALDVQKIDLGIALCHFELAARAAGLCGRWDDADPGLRAPEGTEYLIRWVPEVGE